MEFTASTCSSPRASEGVLRERAQPRAQRHLQDAQASEVAEGGGRQGAQLGAFQPQLPQAANLPKSSGGFRQWVLRRGQEGQIVRMKKREGGGQELEAVFRKGSRSSGFAAGQRRRGRWSRR